MIGETILFSVVRSGSLAMLKLLMEKNGDIRLLEMMPNIERRKLSNQRIVSLALNYTKRYPGMSDEEYAERMEIYETLKNL